MSHKQVFIERQDPELARRFNRVQIGNVCKMRNVWVQRARARADAPKTKLTQKQFDWLTDVWQCDVSAYDSSSTENTIEFQSLACLCKFDPSKTCEKIISQIDEAMDKIPDPSVLNPLASAPGTATDATSIGKGNPFAGNACSLRSKCKRNQVCLTVMELTIPWRD